MHSILCCAECRPSSQVRAHFVSRISTNPITAPFGMLPWQAGLPENYDAVNNLAALHLYSPSPPTGCLFSLGLLFVQANPSAVMLHMPTHDVCASSTVQLCYCFLGQRLSRCLVTCL